MILRIAKESDFQRVHKLMYEIFEKHLLRRPDIYKDGDPYTLNQYKSSLENENEKMLVAEIEGVVVGVSHMAKMEVEEHSIMRECYVAYIEDFCVDKSYQRHGIGKALYEESVKIAKLWNTQMIQLNVWEINEEARKFYDSVGFKVQCSRMELKL